MGDVRVVDLVARQRAPGRERDRWKALISKLYAVLIRISAETAVPAQLSPKI